ncbi:carbohydrate ABC transporter permease [Cellulomonas composti]|uniref:Sugar ABC transporter permease n=1 Tax=Cellulomonas composti TaxID=266130 RepID=A0A511J8X6_9CELL|nr:carbohydrate ABC transporter permease [Cellulomonas composti]GEL94440.1 sugar ABC transporter permease [Cellulomonas composti]
MIDTLHPGPRTRRPLSNRISDRAFNRASVILLSAAVVAVAYPVYFIVIASVSDPSAVQNGDVWFAPSGLTVEGYQRIFSDATIIRGFGNSVLYTSVATAISVALIVSGGYALSRPDLPGRRTITFLLVITLFFDGGMIPRYLVVQQLGMIDTIWAMVLPGAVGVWNLLIARSFFEVTIPAELREAAAIDGASDFRFFFQVALPLAKSLVVLMAMIHLVANWNSFFDALIFLNDADKYPLQLVLRNILVQSDLSSGNLTGDLESYAQAQRVGELVKYATIVVSTLPIIALVPFLQKHFTKGALLGAVKH